MIGDAEQGRSTIPLVYPSFSRLSMPIIMTFWSAFLYIASDASWLVRFATSALGVVVGVRLYVFRSAAEDRISHNLYDVRTTPMICLSTACRIELMMFRQVWVCLMHVALSSLSQEVVKVITQVLRV